MAGKKKILNIQIKGVRFFQIKSIMRRYFNLNISDIYKVTDNDRMFKIILKNKTSVRLDIYRKTTSIKRQIKYQNLLNVYDVRYPRIFGVVETPDEIFKVQKWIDGKRLVDIWKRKEVFIEAGKNIAHINTIQEPESGKYLTFHGFNRFNAIWSKAGDVYLIGDNIRITDDVDTNIANMLFKTLRKPQKINWFLTGYKIKRDTTKIEKMLEDLEQNNETTLTME